MNEMREAKDDGMNEQKKARTESAIKRSRDKENCTPHPGQAKGTTKKESIIIVSGESSTPTEKSSGPPEQAVTSELTTPTPVKQSDMATTIEASDVSSKAQSNTSTPIEPPLEQLQANTGSPVGVDNQSDDPKSHKWS